MIEVKTRSKIKLNDINIGFNKGSTKGGTDLQVSALGRIPMIVIKGVVISEENLITLKLNNETFTPTISASFRDNTNKLNDSLFPLDNEIMSIFIKSTSEMIMPIRMDFKILKFAPKKLKSGKDSDIIIDVEGSLNVDELYYSDFVSYKGTSYDVLQQISSFCGLGFATNITKTNDSMTWINPNHKMSKFIQDITLYSYKDDSSFLWSYIDFYYNLVYVDIETSLTEKDSVNNALPYNVVSNTKKETTTPLFLSNHPDLQSSNQYINKYSIENASTDVNLRIGYKTRVRFYDKTDKNMNTTLLDTISSVGVGDQIVMKDTPNASSTFSKNVVGGTYIGKLDRDNVHPNYLYAYKQNSKNLDFLQKVKMTVTLRGAMNFVLYRFQKVLVKIYDLQDPTKMKEETSSNTNDVKSSAQLDESKINHRLSGEWLITAINYTYSREYGNVQELTLVKRELTSVYSVPVKK